MNWESKSGYFQRPGAHLQEREPLFAHATHAWGKEQSKQGGLREFCDASLTANIQNSRYQEKTEHPSRVAFELIDHHGQPGSPFTDRRR